MIELDVSILCSLDIDRDIILVASMVTKLIKYQGSIDKYFNINIILR